MPAECAFCRLLSHPEEAHIVWEDRDTLAFLDNRPLFPGHCLLIPRRHFGTLTDLPPDLVAPLFASARLLCNAVVAAMHAEGSFVAINNTISQSVPHLHVHVVPRKKKDGLRGFMWPRTTYPTPEIAREVAAAIRRETLRSKPSTPLS